MGKKQDPASMDAPVRVKLSESQVADRGRDLAEKLGMVNAWRAQKKAEGERLQGLIDVALDECEDLRIEILEGAEEKRQGDLFVGEPVIGGGGVPHAPGSAGRITDDTAREVLRTVAQKVGDVPDAEKGA